MIRLDDTIDHAGKILAGLRIIDPIELKVGGLVIWSFPQSWPTTALAFEGVGGRGFTMAQTLVGSQHGHIVVFVGGRYAYHGKSSNSSDYVFDMMSNLGSKGVPTVRDALKNGLLRDERYADPNFSNL